MRLRRMHPSRTHRPQQGRKRPSWNGVHPCQPNQIRQITTTCRDKVPGKVLAFPMYWNRRRKRRKQKANSRPRNPLLLQQPQLLLLNQHRHFHDPRFEEEGLELKSLFRDTERARERQRAKVCVSTTAFQVNQGSFPLLDKAQQQRFRSYFWTSASSVPLAFTSVIFIIKSRLKLYLGSLCVCRPS